MIVEKMPHWSGNDFTWAEAGHVKLTNIVKSRKLRRSK
jgi:hypothetical protein